MPMPVSSTANRSKRESAGVDSGATDNLTVPSPVNLMALPSRLTSTCSSREASPSRASAASSAAVCISKWSPLASAVLRRR